MAEAGTSTVQADKILDGKLVASKVTDKNFSGIEHGTLSTVNALIVHQTGGSTAESSFSSYKEGGNGAHFLIDKDGTIYQTARTDRICWHIGKVQSRCYKLKSCAADELKAIEGILFNKADSYATRIGKLHDHEAAKAYPDRYPTNSDSIGIELVAAYKEGVGYEAATDAQNQSLKWLITTLESLLTVGTGNVFRHPDVSYKQESEASTAAW